MPQQHIIIVENDRLIKHKKANTKCVFRELIKIMIGKSLSCFDKNKKKEKRHDVKEQLDYTFVASYLNKL